MIKRLKRQYILTAMTIIGVILIVTFSSICIFTYNTSKRQTIKRLEQALMMPVAEKPGEAPFFPDNAHSSDRLHPHKGGFELPDLYTFSVLIDGSGAIIMNPEEESSAEEIEAIVGTVLRGDKDSGKVKGFNLLFAKKTTQGGTFIIFTSTAPINNSLKNTAIISAILCIVSFLIFFILIERIAHYTTRPVENAWRVQKQFVADASHDLKTPLTVILANTEILLSHKEDSIKEQEKWLNSTKEEAEKMNKLIIELLDLAKSEAMQKTVELSAINLSDITEKTALQLEPVAFDKSITVSTKIDKNITIISNGEIYSRILASLLDNAIKYSKSEDEIKVSLTSDKKQACLSVNNPSYINEQDLSHIFERFYRSDKSRTDLGHGLGLAIAKNLAASINADLTATSNKENGTTLTLNLKRK